MAILNYIAHKRVNGTGMAKTSPAPMAGASVFLLSISQTLRFLQNDMDQYILFQGQDRLYSDCFPIQNVRRHILFQATGSCSGLFMVIVFRLLTGAGVTGKLTQMTKFDVIQKQLNQLHKARGIASASF